MRGKQPVAMHRIRGMAWVILLAGALSACSASRPIRYYTLAIPPAPATSASPQFPITLLVRRFDASHLYRDDRIVYGSGPVELGMYEYERWAATPVDMVQDLFVSVLRSGGQYRSVARVSSNLSGDYILRGHLYSLYGVDKPALVGRFSVQVDLYDPKSRSILWDGSYTRDEPVNGKTVADVVEALDRNVNEGVHQLAAELGQYFSAHPPQPAPEPD